MKNGFTLIEILMAVSLFVSVMTIGTTVFLSSSRAQQRVALGGKIQSDARFVLGSLSEYIRSGTIDYSFAEYGAAIPVPVETLAILDRQDNPIIFSSKNELAEPGICPDAESSPCLALSLDGGATWNSITSSGVRLESLKFYIRPSQNPYESFGGSFLSNIQPSVTIVLSLESSHPNPDFRNLTFLQTTVTSRLYKR
ncbi:MAG: hypothetical protein G01um101418_608 [Parcubacteria group bacterium Gr01-1014_18]|nr:MAG: hypothetical protein Greene041636_101 [Parcubacteria group bacterium Greene0416_36]TSC80860.1 MAG: hypothetical protein G01um101418_608 [Parcubacteria group bacterium Gr01-1014_18]TSC99521.1 MAG: hypothetical protein Greene101420_188 [Parcubacteria group bacterium Greene1014_20]TSD07560.1 MAG: hypothetical protein Greene07142_17 [Parcubacteria group bacterium Greene0714_2]